MSILLSESDLLQCFRKFDRGDVELSPDVCFPLAFGEAFAWAVGPRAFLVFRDRPEAPLRGIVFHRNSGNQPDVPAMCEWCHSVRRHGGVKLLSVRSSDRRRVGLYLCSDLSCVSRVGDLCGPDDLSEGPDAAHRAQRALRRIADFAARRLF
jgi:hypothetical protein